MRRQRSGLLIHVSSAAGRAVAAYFGIYCASKFALEALAASYRFELAPFGVDSVIVEPGITAHQFWRRSNRRMMKVARPSTLLMQISLRV
jgi:short-subunit dehydrogenase